MVAIITVIDTRYAATTKFCGYILGGNVKKIWHLALEALPLFIALFYTAPAWSTTCLIPNGEKAVGLYDVIVDAIAENATDPHRIILRVEKVYKGNITKNRKITIIQKKTVFDDIQNYVVGKNYILYLSNESVPYEFSDSYCSPSFLKEQAVGFYGNDKNSSINFSYLELINAQSLSDKINVYEDLISEYPHIHIYYDHLAKILAENGEYEKSILTYQRAFKARHITNKQASVSQIEENLNPIYEQLEFYEPSLGITTDKSWYQIGDRDSLLLPYANVLVKARRYEDALKVLSVAKGNANSSKLEALRLEIESYKNGRQR